MLALLIQSSSFLQLFIDSCEDEGCEETALNWVIAVAVVSIVCALLMLGIKWLQKSMRPSTSFRKPGAAVKQSFLIIVGFFPVLHRPPHHLVHDAKLLQLRRRWRAAERSCVRLALVRVDDVYRTSAESVAERNSCKRG